MRISWAVVALSLAAGSGATGARAEAPRYPVDWALAFCAANESGNTALAIADFGTYWCAWDFPTLEAARREAVRRCKASLPGSLARGANCAVIYENGRIVDTARAQRMRLDLRMPVRIESFNGQTGETEVMAGTMTLGEASDTTTRTAQIALSDGTPICTGAARVERLTARFGFTATCFGDQVFAGEAKVTGLVRIGGLNRLGFDLLIRNPPHRARIVTE